MTTIGITGTRKGMTYEQHQKFVRLISRAMAAGPVVLRHGACVGVDHQVHLYAREGNIPVVIHPPTNTKSMMPLDNYGYCLKPKDYLERDRDIVDNSDVLWAFPDGPRRKGSGTWYTVCFAEMQKKPVYIVYPGGSESWSI